MCLSGSGTTMCDLFLVYSDDAIEWTEFFLDLLERYRLQIVTRLDRDLVTAAVDESIHSELAAAKSVVVIASPDHLELLCAHPEFTYRRLDVSRTQIFLCGVEAKEFAEMRDVNGRPLAERLPHFDKWTMLGHDRHSALLTNAMALIDFGAMPAQPETNGRREAQKKSTEDLVKKVKDRAGKRRSRRREFEMVPNRARCEVK